MKKVLYFLSICLVVSSCATSQSAMSKQAQKKVNDLKPVLNLTESQAKAMQQVETEYLLQESKIRNSVNYNKLLKSYKEKRDVEVKKILDYDQYLKYDAIEGKRIKNVPLRV